MNYLLVMFALVIILNSADAVTTMIAISMGLPEANPLVHLVYANSGLVGIALIKTAYIIFAFFLYMKIKYGKHTRRHFALLSLLIVLIGAVVVSNIYGIMMFM